jgi:hypothetical protein
MNQSYTVDFSQALQAIQEFGLANWQASINAPRDPSTDAGVNSLGQVNLSDYSPVTGLQNIQAIVAPAAIGNIKPGELRTVDAISQFAEFHILLMGWYPAIVQKQQVVIVPLNESPAVSLALDIIAAESDSQGIMTRLLARRYEQ